MKVLFLDCDGVLNHRARFRDRKGFHRPLPRGSFVLCPIACGRLISFVEKYNIYVVLSSTWRTSNEHVELLCKAGILENAHDDWRTKDIVASTLVPRGHRGIEINEWLSRHSEVEEYAIIDDDDDFLPDQKSHLVRTSFNAGLELVHIDQLGTILGCYEKDGSCG